MIFLGNAFSLGMLDTEVESAFIVTPVTVAEVASSGFTSVVGHQDTANILSGILGVSVAYNRASVKLERGDVLYVAQVLGGRLPEGATTLPDGIRFIFLKVTVKTVKDWHFVPKKPVGERSKDDGVVVLGLRTLTVNALRKYGINTVEQLASLPAEKRCGVNRLRGVSGEMLQAAIEAAEAYLA